MNTGEEKLEPGYPAQLGAPLVPDAFASIPMNTTQMCAD